MSPTPPPSLAERLRRLRLDPAALPILVAAIVLVGAVAWLLARPAPQGSAVNPATEQALAELRQEVQRLAGQQGNASSPATEQSLADLRQEVQRLADQQGRLDALEARQGTSEGPDLTSLQDRLAAVERSAATLAGRPEVDPASLAPRAALDTLGQRVDTLGQRMQAAIAQEEARATASSDRIEGVARETATRLGTAEQTTAQTATRLNELSASLTQRIAALESALNEAKSANTAQVERIAALEGQSQRLAALEGRAARLAALDQIRAALEAGQPLGGALGTLESPPSALTRYAEAAPPTEAGLRLRFEESARAAMAASDPGRQGEGLLDSAVSRLSGLVTVRRGEQVVWGDAASAEIEKSRRALEAGDLEGSLKPLEKLSPEAQAAMQPWVQQAQALIAARAALRALAAG